MAAAAAFAPATITLRFSSHSTLRFLKASSRFLLVPPKPHVLPPKFQFHGASVPFSGEEFGKRRFCSVVSAALKQSGEMVTAADAAEQPAGGLGNRVGKFRKKLKIADVKGGPNEGLDRVGQTVVVMGWVRTLRLQSSVTFMEVNDGSCLSNMQCVLNPEAEGYDQVDSGSIVTGASVCVQGTIVESQGSKQKVELKVNKIVLVGQSDPSYPMQKKRATREFLRTKAHLRPRTNTFSAVARVRNALAYATHKFFQENGFVWVSSPIITASDCEGAGEQFCVTTLVCSSFSNMPSLTIILFQDFFGKPAFLTVSGQLNAETYATALSDVYTFGPTFRAENSNTSRHLAEFWMIEPELAFADLNDDMACATAYLQYVVCPLFQIFIGGMKIPSCKYDFKFMLDLQDVAEKEFVQLTYTDAVELLLKTNKKFEFPVAWGCDLQSEHERYITEEAFGGCPVIIRDYPKEIKAFYMRQNDDGKTVAAMDLLVPRIGELVGGSQREERLGYLEYRLEELKLNKESYWWYLDLRRYGSVPHAGFGVGFERLVQFATGLENIRDTIPFPRSPGSAEF
ncbi:unnamed protein product [Linum tenue]|uniref:asparagine--tRNA ligase n=1 Tax=Linum tenue TaxID=586396 RepID=A0AAV0JVJ3_9ROSI|nr:unnamed protein product [Linum tenue]